MDLASIEPHVNGLYDYFDKKIGFQKPPTIHFDSDPSNQSKVLGKTAYYDPSSLEIHVFTDGRHPKDMLRSIAHELIHHQQNEEGRLDVGGYMGEGYYLKNEEMKKLEQEAMLKGNSLMREYEDNLKIEEKNSMSLKEWKNNELNQQLMKKFGLLQEAPFDGGASVGKAQLEENEEELEEGRVNPRAEKSDKFVGHEDRLRPDRMHEEEELEEGEEVIEEGEEDVVEEEINEEIEKKKNKMNNLKESIKRIARANKIVLKSLNKRIK